MSYGARQYRSGYKQTKARGQMVTKDQKAQRQAFLASRRPQTIPRAFVKAATPETRYFDVGINTACLTAGTTWADTEVPADFYVNSAGSPAAYTDSTLIPTAQGTAYGQVTGNRYKLKKVRVRGRLSVGVTTGQTGVLNPCSVRVLLVCDYQPNGAQAQGEIIMQDFGAAPENEHSFLSMAEAPGRFQILSDKTYLMNPATAVNNAAGTTVSQNYNDVKFKCVYAPRVPVDVMIKNGNATPTVAGCVSHNIFLLCYASSYTAALSVTMVAASRAYYCE